MQLELREGRHVQSAGGQDLGRVREFVVKPSTREFTHVLLEKGVFFTDDRVVPIETIDRVEEDAIVLNETVDPGTLPRFVREHYTPIDEETCEKLARNEVIDTRTPVISTDGEKVGSVSEVLVNDDGQLSHLVVDLGFLSDDKVLPAHWVEKIESDGIRLAVSNTAVEPLETIT